MSVYSGTKAFVYAFTQALVNELKDSNVSMTALIPGASDTDFFKKAKAEHTMIYNDTKLSDPAVVAKDGYAALMKGKSKVISGMKNKVQVAMSNVLPEKTVTKGARKTMEGKKEDKKEDES
jgi:short-subunit dehydrogenase